MVFSDGSDNFQFLDQMSFFDSHLRILASNATLILGDDEQWLGGSGVLLEIDHLDFNSNIKETSVKFCTDLGTEIESCQLLSKQVYKRIRTLPSRCEIEDILEIFLQIGSNYLENGKSWVEFSLSKNMTDDDGEVVEYEFKKMKSSNGELELIANWTQESNRYAGLQLES